MLGKIIAALIMRKTISPGIPLFQRLLAGMAAMLILSLIASILTGALVVGGVYFVYNALIVEGLDPQIALAGAGTLLFVLILALVLTTAILARNLRGVVKRIMIAEHPITHRVTSIADAFVEGLTTRRAA